MSDTIPTQHTITEIENQEISDKSIPSATTLYDATRAATYQILNALEDHKRTVIRDVIDVVIVTTSCPSTIATGLVPMFCHEWADAGNGTVEKGRLGGVYKGGSVKRVDQRVRCETCKQVLRPMKVHTSVCEHKKEGDDAQ